MTRPLAKRMKMSTSTILGMITTMNASLFLMMNPKTRRVLAAKMTKVMSRLLLALGIFSFLRGQQLVSPCPRTDRSPRSTSVKMKSRIPGFVASPRR